jgi:hypothetical protein
MKFTATSDQDCPNLPALNEQDSRFVGSRAGQLISSRVLVCFRSREASCYGNGCCAG